MNVLFNFQVACVWRVDNLFFNVRKINTLKLYEVLSKMPKSQTNRIAAAQRQRKILTSKGEKYGPSAVSLQVIGSGAQGAPKAVYLFTDQKRYLFNCGEGTQRLAHEHKIKLSRLEHIFITNKTWACLGGLPGVSLTLQDVGVPKITLHGPPGLYELYDATRRFVVIKDMEVSMATCTALNDFEDSSMTVKYVPLTPETESYIDENPTAKRMRLSKEEAKHKSNPLLEEFEHDETDYYGHETRKPLETQSKSLNSPERHSAKKKQDRKYVDYGKHNNCSMAYICTLRKRLGTLDIEKCVQKGVKPGPNLGLLKNGQDVVLSDGTVVMSADVKTPDDPGPVFIVLDVPALSYLKEYEFRKHFDDGKNPPENLATVIIHFTPKHVINQPRYKEFMKKFGAKTQHLVINEQNSCQGLVAVHRMQHKLHLLDNEIFPIIKDYSIPMDWTAESHMNLETNKKVNAGKKLKILEEIKNKVAVAQFQSLLNMEADSKISADNKDSTADDSSAVSAGSDLLSARTLTTFHLRPKRELDRSNELKLKIYEYIQETMDVDNFPESLEQFQKYVENEKFKDGNFVSRPYPKVVFLGTGSCIPNKTRNTSAIVVQLKENHNILLDCGEGTYGQLVRYYGTKGVQEFLFNLKAIYVSHLHADHHIGLISILQGRRRVISEMKDLSSVDPVQEPPLYLLAPGQIMTWLSVYHQQFEEIRNDYQLIPTSTLMRSDSSNEMTPAILSYIGLSSIQTCLVSHCPNAFGVAFTINDVDKITYSGDTVPCDNLVLIGANSSLLIHEATMEDELASEARYKMHSTTSQAITVGDRMKANFTILTHFSQRYARLPRLNDQILQAKKNVGIAFDNMEVTLDDLKFLPHMYAPLQLMFAEHCVEMEMRAAKRELKNNLRPVTPPSPRRLSGKEQLKKPIKNTCGKRTSSSVHIVTAKRNLPSNNNKSPPLSECSAKSIYEKKNSLNGDHRTRVSTKSLLNKDNRCIPFLEHCIKNSYKENRASRMRHQVLRASIKNIIKPRAEMDLEMNIENLGHYQRDFNCFKDYEKLLQNTDKSSLNSFTSKKAVTVPFKSKTFSEKSLPISDKSVALSESSNLDYGLPLLLPKNVTLKLQKNPDFNAKEKLSPKPNLATAEVKCTNKLVAERRHEILSKQKLLQAKNENAAERPLNTDFNRLKCNNTLLSKKRQEYLSKQKFHEDKFDKIEGLNWISWK